MEKFPIGTDVIVTIGDKTYEGVAYDENYILYVLPSNEEHHSNSVVVSHYGDMHPPLVKYVGRQYHCLNKSDPRITHATTCLGGE